VAQLNVNLADVDESNAEGGGFTVNPRGRYLLQITEGEVKRNSKNTGDLFEFEVEVLEEGPAQGSKIKFLSINVSHDSAQARNIGQAQLKALTLACGLDPATTTDTDQFLYQPFMADLEIETYESKGKTREKNVIKRYIHAGNQHELPPGSEAPANDNKAAPTSAANNNTPSTARQTHNAGAAATTAAASGTRSMPWKK
jgi:hypothetical protein